MLLLAARSDELPRKPPALAGVASAKADGYLRLATVAQFSAFNPAAKTR